MNLLFQFLMLIVIGALIGGVTNSLAIKMLFRPYHPIFIGKWRLPFTPGLIPKRRNELAEQLGETVMNHLLTPESIRRKLHDEQFQDEVLQWARAEARRIAGQNISLEELAESQFGVSGLTERWHDEVDAAIHGLFGSVKGKTIEEAVPEKWLTRIDEKIPYLAEYISEEGVRFLESPQGRAAVRTLLEQFFSGRGMFSNMLQMFFGSENMGGKLQTEMVKLFRQPMFQRMIVLFLEKQWNDFRGRKVDDFPVEAISDEVSKLVKREVPVDHWLERPLAEWTAPYQEKLLGEWLPRVVQWGGEMISARVGELLKYLHLEDVVKKQVETFAVERLEELVLSISRREFKMITYLGALLGGIIGLVQGILMQLFA
jgi:uncharacterized membrane protein YheB (UPF0754 family)